MSNIKVKFVNKANQWCVTYWDADGKQQQEWFSVYEDAVKRTTEL